MSMTTWSDRELTPNDNKRAYRSIDCCELYTTRNQKMQTSAKADYACWIQLWDIRSSFSIAIGNVHRKTEFRISIDYTAVDHNGGGILFRF